MRNVLTAAIAALTIGAFIAPAHAFLDSTQNNTNTATGGAGGQGVAFGGAGGQGGQGGNGGIGLGGRGGTGVGIGVGRGGNARSNANASAGASAGASSIGVNDNTNKNANLNSLNNRNSLSTKQLNEQSLRNANTAKQGQGQFQDQSNEQGQAQGANNDQGQSNSIDGDDSDVDVYAISYADTQPQAPQAAIGSGDVVVTTWGVKVLGPVFGMTDQHVHKTPGYTVQLASVIEKASISDGSVQGKNTQAAYLAALCATDEDAASIRFGEDACEDIGGTVNW